MQTQTPCPVIDVHAEVEVARPQAERTEFHELYDLLYGAEGGSKALARALGVNPSTVFRWLQGKRDVPEAILEYMRETARDADDLTEHVEAWAGELVDDDGEDPHVVAAAFKRIGHAMSMRPSVRVRADAAPAE